MLTLLLCALVSIACAIYGVYDFTSTYTCWLVKWNNGLKKTCQSFMWIPSALVVACVLGLVTYRAMRSDYTPTV